MRKHIKELPVKRGGVFYKFLFCVYTPLLIIITLLPAGIIQSESAGWLSKFGFKGLDKLVHLLLFFVFTWLFFYSGFSKKKYKIWLLPLLTGILIELTQELTGWGRTFDLLDIMANTVGIMTAYFLLVKKL